MVVRCGIFSARANEDTPAPLCFEWRFHVASSKLLCVIRRPSRIDRLTKDSYLFTLTGGLATDFEPRSIRVHPSLLEHLSGGKSILTPAFILLSIAADGISMPVARPRERNDDPSGHRGFSADSVNSLVPLQLRRGFCQMAFLAGLRACVSLMQCASRVRPLLMAVQREWLL